MMGTQEALAALDRIDGDLSNFREYATTYAAPIATIRAALEENGRDAERYRWLRSEEVATDPRYYEFWEEFNVKLCREERMDAAIDAARAAEGG